MVEIGHAINTVMTFQTFQPKSSCMFFNVVRFNRTVAFNTGQHVYIKSVWRVTVLAIDRRIFIIEGVSCERESCQRMIEMLKGTCAQVKTEAAMVRVAAQAAFGFCESSMQPTVRVDFLFDLCMTFHTEVALIG